jgi:hypothetical protein
MHFGSNRQYPRSVVSFVGYPFGFGAPSGCDCPRHEFGQLVGAIQTTTGRIRAWLLCKFVDELALNSPIEQLINEG